MYLKTLMNNNSLYKEYIDCLFIKRLSFTMVCLTFLPHSYQYYVLSVQSKIQLYLPIYREFLCTVTNQSTYVRTQSMPS